MNTDNILSEYTEETSLDGQNGAAAQVLNENTDIPSMPVGDSAGWRKVAMGTGFGIVFGTAAAVVTDHFVTRKEETVVGPHTDENPTEEASTEEAEATASLHPYVDDEVQIATSVSDDMTFSHAFAAARAEVGSGGAFEWRGNLYNTFTAEEWDSMTPQQHAEYGSHFDWAAYNSTTAHATHATAHDTPQHTGDHNATPMEGQSNDVAVIDSYEPDIEVLGAIPHQEPDLNTGGVLIDEQNAMLVDVDNDGMPDAMLVDVDNDGKPDVVLVDMDNDGKPDVVVSDFNHDGELQEDEIFVTVKGMGDFTDTIEDTGYWDGSALM